MEIYVAISDFTPPIVDGSQNILEFKKGDSFEIFDSSNTEADWWGARALKTNIIGYVPSRYMQDQKETSLKHLSDIQSNPNYKAPERSYSYDMEKEPEPDYNDNDEQGTNIEDVLNIQLKDGQQQKERSPSMSSDEGLIGPKKLKNPCIDSAERQALHKELLLNYKRGVNVLEKPELSKVLQHRRETQKKKEWEEQTKSKRTSLEMKLEQRATKLKSDDDMQAISEEEKPELQKVFAKITQKSNGHVK